MPLDAGRHERELRKEGDENMLLVAALEDSTVDWAFGAAAA